MNKTSLLLVSVLAMISPAHAVDASLPTGVAGIPLLSPGSTQAEVDAQVRANIAHRRATYEATGQAGGCNADFQPVEIAAYCWGNAMGGSRDNPQGGAVGHSIGGSDSSDGGAAE
jgi:hypothetical protein